MTTGRRMVRLRDVASAWFAAAAIALAALAPAPAAADPTQLQKLLHPGAEPDHRFGIGVSLSASTMAVSCLGPSRLINVTGEVCIFDHDGQAWTHTTTLVPTFMHPDDIFGEDIALQGDTLLVGALGDSSRAGAVYVFERELGQWTQTAKLTPIDPTPGRFFGAAVAMHGDAAVFGAYGDTHNGTNSGAAYVFERASTGGGVGASWLQAARLFSEDSGLHDEFGSAVAIHTDTVVVGASSHQGARGAAYVYRCIDDIWTFEAKLIASDRASGDLFGVSVAICEDTIIVGALRADPAGTDSGAAYVFQRNPDPRAASLWTETAKLIPVGATPGELFGITAVIDGDAAVIGATDDNGLSDGAGAAYLFRRSPSGTGAWTQRARITASDAGAGDAFGWRLALDGGTALIGAPFDTELGPVSGAAYIFDVSIPPCPADLDADGAVGASDLAILLGSWSGENSPADLDGDGDVNAADLAILLGSWGACP